MAMDRQQINDPFHRQLYDLLVPAIAEHTAQIVDGSAKSFDDYRYKCGFLSALQVVLDRCEEVEREMYGARPGAESK